MNKQQLNLYKLKNKEWILSHLPIISFFLMSIIYFIVACYKLTYAPLWYDEIVEFYYSQHIYASEIPGRGICNMYQRIIGTFQPPLYNFLMCFWLKINQSEWWFRFAGVIMGYIGIIGVYCSVKHITNYKCASVAILMYTCTYSVIYYIQECAEYNLLLGLLPWTIYFFFQVLENASWKNTILFTLFSILSIYSQYGAVFAVIPMILLIFINIVLSKNWIDFKKILIGYICAFIFAAIPLYVLFLKPQIANQLSLNHVARNTDELSFFNNNPIQDFVKNMFDCFRWHMIGGKLNSNPAIIPTLTIIIFLLIIIALLCFFRLKNKKLNLFICSNFVSIILFYIAAKAKIYAYPSYANLNWNCFTNRYSIFFVPLWIILIVLLVYFSIKHFSIFNLKKNTSNKLLAVLFVIFFIICTLNIVVSKTKIRNNDNTPLLVEKWFDFKCFDSKTLFLEFSEYYEFAYYLRKDNRYKSSLDKEIILHYNFEKTLKDLLNKGEEKITICSIWWYGNKVNNMYKICDYYKYNRKLIHNNNGTIFILSKEENDE